MRIRKIAVYLLVAAVILGAVSCKKSAPASDETGQKSSKSVISKVTEENFRSFPAADESMFNVEHVNGGVALTKCKAELKDKVIVVPEMISGAEVVAVARGAFYENDDVVAIVLPDTVKIIEGSAFFDCENLKYVYLGSGLKETGDMVFNYCGSIEKIEFPEGIERIGGIIACDCASLKEIIIPASATDIPNGIMVRDDFNGVIKTPAGSVAEKIALEDGLKVENY